MQRTQLLMVGARCPRRTAAVHGCTCAPRSGHSCRHRQPSSDFCIGVTILSVVASLPPPPSWMKLLQTETEQIGDVDVDQTSTRDRHWIAMSFIPWIPFKRRPSLPRQEASATNWTPKAHNSGQKQSPVRLFRFASAVGALGAEYPSPAGTRAIPVAMMGMRSCPHSCDIIARELGHGISAPTLGGRAVMPQRPCLLCSCGSIFHAWTTGQNTKNVERSSAAALLRVSSPRRWEISMRRKRPPMVTRA